LKVHTFAPAEFLSRAGSWLEEREVEHHLFFRITGRFKAGVTTNRPAPWLATVEQDGKIVAAAFMTPPYPLVISNAPPEARAALMAHLDGMGLVPSGVNGHADASTAFAREWAVGHGGSSEIAMRLGVFEAISVIPPAPVPGSLRMMEERDVELVARWLHSFSVEALLPHEQESESEALASARERLGRRTMFLWDDGTPRAMAAGTGPSPHGMCINAVYTPPEFRRQGFASACVAGLTGHLLHEGRRFVCLFTDLSNPTSNSIYRKIGYKHVCEFADWKLLPSV